MKKLTTLLLSSTMVLSMAACGAESDPAGAVSGAAGAYSGLEPVTLILADGAATGAAGALFDELITEKAAEITGGQLTIDFYTNGELGADTDLLRQMQQGDIDMVGSQFSSIVSFCPETAVLDLPMVFATVDGDKIDQVLNGDSETRAALDQAFENAGWHLLGFLQNATFRLTTANTDLRTLADYKDLMIRTMENPNHMAFWTAIGAAPTPMAWNEVYFALQSGNITAQENAADTIVNSNLYEVQDYLVCTNHILYLNQISINKDTWESLDPLYQEALEQAVDEAVQEMRPQMTEIDQQSKALLEENGMTIIEYDQSFFDQILALPEVQALYRQIDADTNGMATILQEELAS